MRRRISPWLGPRASRRCAVIGGFVADLASDLRSAQAPALRALGERLSARVREISSAGGDAHRRRRCAGASRLGCESAADGRRMVSVERQGVRGGEAGGPGTHQPADRATSCARSEDGCGEHRAHTDQVGCGPAHRNRRLVRQAATWRSLRDRGGSPLKAVPSRQILAMKSVPPKIGRHNIAGDPRYLLTAEATAARHRAGGRLG